MSKKLCAIHGVHSFRRCPKCVTTSNRSYDKNYRNKEADKFYHSRQWKQVRKMQLNKYPLCVECSMPARIVDHIKEIKDGGERLSLDNLQSMCVSCHNIKTAKAKQHRGGAVKSLQTKDTNTVAPSKLSETSFLGGTPCNL